MKHICKAVPLTALLSVPGIGLVAQDDRPNILCIVCEDTSAPYFDCYGGGMGVTPIINGLAEEGVRYSNFYTTMGVSAPSRHALITGMYPSATGGNNMRTRGGADAYPKDLIPYDVVLPAGVKCYTEYLRANGYYCINNAKTDYQFASPLTAWDECGNNAHWKNAPEGMPFFAIFNLNVTHESYVWKNAKKPLTVDPAKVPVPPYFPDTEAVRQDIARVYSNMAIMDQQVGEKIDEVRQAGKLGNTIVIFYSDNGGPLLRQKRSIYEAGLHVPLIIRYPDGRGAGTTDDRMCSFVDIPATMMSLLGIMPPDYMHGKAFAGEYEAPARQYVYGALDRCDEFVDKIGAIRDDRYLYIRNYMTESPGYKDVAFRRKMPMMMDILEKRDAGELDDVQMSYFVAPRPLEEFYDVASDPHNINNLINDPAYREEIDRMRDSYDQWIHDYNEMWFWPEQQLSEFFQPGGVQRVADKPVFVADDNGKVSIYCPLEGASIAYKVNGKGFSPKHWMLYTGPFECKPGDKIEAVAVRVGYKQSPTVEMVL